MSAPNISFREADRTFTPQVEEGMVLAYLLTAQRGPTTELEDGPVTLRSDGDVDRHIGLKTSTLQAVEDIKYFVGKGAKVKAVVVKGAGAVTATKTLVDSGSSACAVFNAKNLGAWGNSLTVTITDDPSDAVNFFKIAIGYALQTDLAEVYEHVSMDPSSRYYIEYLINDVSNLVTVEVLTANRPATIAADALIGGADGAAPTAANYQTALALFTADNELTHLSWYSTELIQGEVWSHCVTYADARADLFVLEAIPEGYTPTQGVSYRQGAGGYGFSDIDSSYTTLVFGGPKIRNAGSYGAQPTDAKRFLIGQYAAKMATSYPWIEVAGPERGLIPGALGVRYNVLNTADAETFADEQINPIVWDQSKRKAYIRDVLTCQKAPTQLQFCGVREGMNWVKRRFRYHAAEIMFDPNDPTAWRLLYQRMKVDLDFAGANRGLDGFEGDGWQYTGDQESIRRQDATFNSQSDLIQGKYKVAIYLVWISPIREIELTAVLTKSSIEFTEE